MVWSSVDELQEIAGTLAFLGVALLALLVGRTGHRWAGVITLLDGVGLVALASVFEHADRVLMVQAKAVVILVLYAALVVQRPSGWIMGLVSLQTVAVLVHLSPWFDRSVVIFANGFVLNAIGWSMLGLLFLAVVADIARRVTRRYGDAGAGP